jgi:hypothetical protein
MQALHYVCLMNPANIVRLAACGGMGLVTAGACAGAALR